MTSGRVKMDAGETNLGGKLTTSFRLSGDMQRPKRVRGPTCVLLLAVTLLGGSLAEEQDFQEDFLKQEYSLAKPYRGERASEANRV